MKFCKVNHMEESQDSNIMNNQNQNPNIQINPTAKTIEEALPKDYTYQHQIEIYLLSIQIQSSQQQTNNKSQTEISDYMRGILVSWLVEVHMKYKLMGETFFLTIKIIDRYLFAKKIQRNRLQLLGIAALWIASKYQETYQVPKLANLVYICDNAFSSSEILWMQGDIITSVGFHILTQPSVLAFFQIIQNHAKLDLKDYWLGRYLLQAATFDSKLQKYSPAILSYSLIFFIKKLRNYHHHSEDCLKQYLDINDHEIRTISRQLCGLWQKIESLECLTSLRQKYGESQFMQVSKIRLSERTK